MYSIDGQRMATWSMQWFIIIIFAKIISDIFKNINTIVREIPDLYTMLQTTFWAVGPTQPPIQWQWSVTLSTYSHLVTRWRTSE